MSDDVVKAEVNAVLALKHGVERYSERLRSGLTSARRELDTADREAQEVLAQRRSDVQRCEQDLRRAEAALRQCQENCHGLQQAVAKASQRLSEATQRLDRARKGAQLIAEARSSFAKSGQQVESVVNQHHSIASAALGNLEAKLRHLSGIYPMIVKAAADVLLTKAAAELLTRAAGAAVGLQEVPDPFVGQASENIVESFKHGLEYLGERAHGKE